MIQYFKDIGPQIMREISRTQTECSSMAVLHSYIIFTNLRCNSIILIDSLIEAIRRLTKSGGGGEFWTK